MRHRAGAGRWEVTNWAEYLLATRQVAAGLAELGVGPGGRTAILSANRPEWHLADLGTMANRGVTVPIYPTSSPEQVRYVLDHAAVEICFVDSHAQLGKVLQSHHELPHLRRIVLIDESRRGSDTEVIGFDELRALGADRITRDPTAVDERYREVRPDDLATIVYTSGTTGPPKGVMVTHHNIMWTLRSATSIYPLGQGERLLSFLPLSHIAERMISDFMPIGVTGETWFARSLATIAEDLPECRPTTFLAVPRVWEKLREGIEERLGHQPAVVRAAAARYLSLGLRRVDASQGGPPLPGSLEAVHEALNRTIGAAIRRQVGLDQAQVLASAAAPIHPDLVRWFHAVGLPLVQIYGQTEGCGPTTGNPPGHIRIGTVGSALPGMSVKVATDGEILLKGGNVCKGYLDDPAATSLLIDEGGWMHTGDTGAFDLDGSLRVLGRKKDLIITAAGKNISPQSIETDLRNHPLVSEAVVVGEARRYLTALITLDPEEVTRWADKRDKLPDLEALSEDPDVHAEIAAFIDQVNSKRSQAEHIRKFRILAHDLTSARGELTPTMKVKRSVVYERYAEVIEELYAGS
jgi:long-chain acyl-CoA synthetase